MTAKEVTQVGRNAHPERAPARVARSSSRIATVSLPCLGLQLHARSRAPVKGLPLAIEGVAAPLRGKVAECSRAALRAGVHVGQTMARARAACPELVVVAQDPPAEVAVAREVAEALQSVSPRVAWAGGGSFHLDASGLILLHGSERGLLLAACHEVQALGFVARAACASSRLVASLATRMRPGTSVIPDEGTAAFLDPLSLSLLPLPREVAARLALLGVRTLGQLARLPADGLADRFGRELARWRRLARGEEDEPLVPLATTKLVRIARELEHPVDGLEPAIFLLRSCCEELADELARRGLAAAKLELSFVRDSPPGGRDERVLEPSRPLSGARPLFDLCRLELETRPLFTPFVGLDLAVLEEVEMPAVPGELFGGGVDPGVLAAAVDRLRALFGREAVLVPAPRAAHRREARIAWAPFLPACPEAAASAETAPEAIKNSTIERFLDPPLAVSVRLPARAGPADGGPASKRTGVLSVLASDQARAAASGVPERVELIGRVGPLRVSGEWWEGGHDVDRDEFLLFGTGGGGYRAFRDRRTGRWLLAGFED